MPYPSKKGGDKMKVKYCKEHAKSFTRKVVIGSETECICCKMMKAFSRTAKRMVDRIEK